MTRFLLKNARIVDPVSGLDTHHDILITDGTIERIGEGLSETGAETVDLAGMIIAPGFCDMHVHFREPGQEHKEDIASGAAAEEPCIPFSTKTTTTILASSRGAKAANQAWSRSFSGSWCVIFACFWATTWTVPVFPQASSPSAR